MTKTVIVSCGTAVATSTVAAKAIEEACKKAGIAVVTKQCKSAELQGYISQGADLIVSTTQMRFDPGIPVLNGLPFLTGMGKDKLIEEILELLKD
jgi:galactitol PTS system EIIB component